MNNNFYAKLHAGKNVSWFFQVNITMLRSRGTFNSVLLSYQTVSNTAISGLDFVPAMGQVLFEPGVTLQTVSLEILDDDLPEGPEVFYVNITQVELLNNRYGMMALTCVVLPRLLTHE